MDHDDIPCEKRVLIEKSFRGWDYSWTDNQVIAMSLKI